jgi:hypothetical protein
VQKYKGRKKNLKSFYEITMAKPKTTTKISPTIAKSVHLLPDLGMQSLIHTCLLGD